VSSAPDSPASLYIPTSLYVHWPYCARICPYCDFNVHKQRPDSDLLPAILDDMSHQRALTGPRILGSLHLGGGTPSLMEPAQVAAIINHAAGLWGLDPSAEIALEANPSLLDAARITAFRDAGINRLSLGVQTFHDSGLALLGRDHSGEQAARVAATALALIPNTSLDLIFGWHGQTLAMWQHDLNTALALGPPHISTYQLTIEPDTAFARAVSRGQSRAVDSDTSADFYDAARATLSAYEHYEVSNFAKPGHQSRHNLSYWRGHDYIGVGPGAHGRLTLDGTRHATVTPLHPKTYAETPRPTLDPLTPDDVLTERILMGLRTTEGIALTELPAHLDWSHYSDYLVQRDDRLVATPAGRPLLDSLTTLLINQI